MDIQSSDLYISISKHHFLVNFLLQCDIIISIRNRNHFTYHTIPSFSRRRTSAEQKNNHYSGSDEQNDEHAKQNPFGKASLGVLPAPLFISLSKVISGHPKSLKKPYKIKSHPARLTYPNGSE